MASTTFKIKNIYYNKISTPLQDRLPNILILRIIWKPYIHHLFLSFKRIKLKIKKNNSFHRNNWMEWRNLEISRINKVNLQFSSKYIYFQSCGWSFNGNQTFICHLIVFLSFLQLVYSVHCSSIWCAIYNIHFYEARTTYFSPFT